MSNYLSKTLMKIFASLFSCSWDSNNTTALSHKVSLNSFNLMSAARPHDFPPTDGFRFAVTIASASGVRLIVLFQRRRISNSNYYLSCRVPIEVLN